MSDELRERVAKAIYGHWWAVTMSEPPWEKVDDDWRNGILGQAAAAIAIVRAEVLEEAARVADKTFGEGYHVAAAIRALKDAPA